MLRMLTSRLPQMVVVVIGCSLVAFGIVNLLPGDVAHTILGEAYTPEAAAELRHQLNLDQPFPIRYVDWLAHAVTGNLGTSLTATHEQVGTMLWRALPPTLELVLLGQIFAVALAIVTAVISVAVRSRTIDRLLSAVALFSSSVPGFVLGLLLLELLAINVHWVSPLGWVSVSQGGLGANLSHIALPALLVGLHSFPLKMRVLRAELVEQLDYQDYIVLARIKGIRLRRVIMNHAVRNASFGLVTLVGVSTARLVGGVVVIESVFSIPGMGTLIKNSVVAHDSPTAVACITVVAIFVVIANLIVDLSYGLLDPRVREVEVQ